MVRAALSELFIFAALLLGKSGAALLPVKAMREDTYMVDTYPRRTVERNLVHFGDYPFIVFVERRPNTHVCDGSVVSLLWVVTSAQMISTVPETVRDGVKVRAGSLERGRGGVLHDTVKLVTHPSFNEPHMYENDVALIKVKHSFTHDNYVKPIRMATLQDSLPAGTLVTACGWGKGRHGGVSQYLLRTSLRIISNRRCDSSRGITRLREKLGPQVRITDTMLCAAASYRDTTTGDSGGPLFLVQDEKPLLVGIISWGEGRGEEDSPGVYTSIVKYRKWMFMEMASAGLMYTATANGTSTVDELP